MNLYLQRSFCLPHDYQGDTFIGRSYSSLICDDLLDLCLVEAEIFYICVLPPLPVLLLPYLSRFAAVVDPVLGTALHARLLTDDARM